MNEILIKSISYLLILSSGYGAKKLGLLKKSDSEIVSRIVVYITLPFAILSNTSSYRIDSTVFLLIVFAITANFIMVWITKILFTREPEVLQSTAMLNTSGYNVGNLTLAFIASFFGREEIIYLSMFDLGNSLMCLGGNFAVTKSMLIKSSLKNDIRVTVNSLLKSPPFMTYLFIFGMSLIQVKIPNVALDLVRPISQANIFLVMLMIGLRIEFHFDKVLIKKISKIILLRMMGSVVFSCITWFLPLSLVAKQIVTMCLFSPCTSVAPIFSKQLGDDTFLPALINSMSIVFSFVILSIWLIVFHRF